MVVVDTRAMTRVVSEMISLESVGGRVATAWVLLHTGTIVLDLPLVSTHTDTHRDTHTRVHTCTDTFPVVTLSLISLKYV